MKLKLIVILLTIIATAGCDHPEQLRDQNDNQVTPITKSVNHPQRPTIDIARDKIRAPEKVLQFFDVKQGEVIVELLAANGYYSELLSRCVGDTGKVYMQNNKKFYEFQTDKNVLERLMGNRLPNVIRWDKELTNLQLEENSLDKFLMILVLHDMYWMEKDVDLVIQEIYKTLKPDGILGIVDHQAKSGTGIQHASDVQGLHRIDKKHVIETMLRNGFVLEDESFVLSHPEDDRSKAFFSPQLKGKPTDRFMLRFKKPRLL